KSLELGRQPDLTEPASRGARECEQLMKMDDFLPDLLEGKAHLSDAPSRIQFAEFCLHHKDLPATAAKLYREAFALKPAWAEDGRGDRPPAGWAGARAGGGQGRDARARDEAGGPRGREQARPWLPAGWELWGRGREQRKTPPPAVIRRRLQQWQRERDLDGL